MENWKQIIDEDEVIGKTIERIHLVSEMYFLLFTDKTFAIITRWDYDDGCIMFKNELIKLEFSPYNYSLNNALVEVGIKTQKQLDKFRKINREKEEKAKQDQELETLKRLKEKYPNIV